MSFPIDFYIMRITLLNGNPFYVKRLLTAFGRSFIQQQKIGNFEVIHVTINLDLTTVSYLRSFSKQTVIQIKLGWLNTCVLLIE